MSKEEDKETLQNCLQDPIFVDLLKDSVEVLARNGIVVVNDDYSD